MELHKTLTLTLNEEQGNRVVKKIRTLSKVLRGLRTGDKFTMALFSLVTAFFICNIVFMGGTDDKGCKNSSWWRKVCI